jgi:chromatin segregation and condensation protein Rec8/ScpA/Scc1 (kleisin family)
MPSSPSDFDIITLPKPIAGPPLKTYAAIIATPVNEQVENIKKVYSEKMAKLDRDLSQEVKRHLDEERQMKIVITHLVKKKEQLEEKLAKNIPPAKPAPPTSKPLTSSKPITTKTTASSSPILKKQSSNNIKYTLINHSKEVLTLKSPFYIKFDQIQIEKIETKTFNILTPRQGDNMQKK